MAEENEVIEVEPEEAGSVEPERTRHVQFIFDSKMVEFEVPWTQQELETLVTQVMKDDGYVWVPQDEERGTGAYINLNNCTNIKLLEREAMRPIDLEPAPESVGQLEEPKDDVPKMDASEPRPVEELAAEFLDSFCGKYGLPKFDGMFNKTPTKFLTAMLSDRFGVDLGEAEGLLSEYRETTV